MPFHKGTLSHAMSDLSWQKIRQLVFERANGCCEYCQTCEGNTGQTMQVDHIHPNGGDNLDNLCLSCWSCNNYKRDVTTIFDSEINDYISLYHPRIDIWDEHFVWVNNFIEIKGLTRIGNVTVERLKMNRPILVVARQRWVKVGFHPPTKK